MGLRVSLAFTFASLRPGGIISRRGQRGKVRGGYGLRDSALQCSSPCPRGRGPATNFTNFTNSEQAIGARPAGIDRAGSPPTCLRRQAQPDPDWATHIMRGSGGRRSPARGFGGARAPPQRHAGQPMARRFRGGDGPIWIAAACCRRNSASQRPGLPGAHSTHGPPLPPARLPAKAGGESRALFPHDRGQVDQLLDGDRLGIADGGATVGHRHGDHLGADARPGKARCVRESADAHQWRVLGCFP